MIYGLARDVDSILQRRHFPTRVVYGPEYTLRDGFDPVIVLERDRRATDLVRATQGVERNPGKVRVRELAARALIYARSGVDGARVNEHEAEAERLVDALIVALQEWGTSTRAGDLPITEARFLPADDPEVPGEFQAWPGVIYLLKFRVPRAVRALDYTGRGRLEGVPAGATTTVINIRRNGSTDPPEVLDLE